MKKLGIIFCLWGIILPLFAQIQQVEGNWLGVLVDEYNQKYRISLEMTQKEDFVTGFSILGQEKEGAYSKMKIKGIFKDNFLQMGEYESLLEGEKNEQEKCMKILKLQLVVKQNKNWLIGEAQSFSVKGETCGKSQIQLLQESAQNEQVHIRFTAKDSDNQLISDFRIIFPHEESRKINLYNLSSHEYKMFSLEKYAFSITAKGFYPLQDSILIVGDSTFYFTLQKIKKDDHYVLQNLFFERGTEQIKPESFAALQQLHALLTQNPTMKVQICGHTDNVGLAAQNLKLSYMRANAIVNYLVKRGVKIENVLAKGYGSQKPIATNATEEGRKQNRRVECVILSIE